MEFSMLEATKKMKDIGISSLVSCGVGYVIAKYLGSRVISLAAMGTKGAGAFALTTTVTASLFEEYAQAKHQGKITPAMTILSYALAGTAAGVVGVVAGFNISIPTVAGLTMTSLVSAKLTQAAINNTQSSIPKDLVHVVKREKGYVQFSVNEKHNAFIRAEELRKTGAYDVNSAEVQEFIKKTEGLLSFKAIADAFANLVENKFICPATTSFIKGY
jgi:hypothetical protein